MDQVIFFVEKSANSPKGQLSCAGKDGRHQHFQTPLLWDSGSWGLEPEPLPAPSATTTGSSYSHGGAALSPSHTGLVKKLEQMFGIRGV